MPDSLDYPQNVCYDCGKAAAKASGTTPKKVFGAWAAKCDVCGEEKEACAAPRDFGYPKFPTKKSD